MSYPYPPPPQPQGPPPGYGYPAPPQGPPGYPATTPQYGQPGYPAQPQSAPPAAAQVVPAGPILPGDATHPFSSPGEAGGGDPAPRPRDLDGCLVAYAPKSLTKAGAPGNDKGVGNSPPRDRVTADLYVLDTGGRAIHFGGSPEWDQDPKPHYLQVVGPARFSGVWVNNTNMVRFALAPNDQPRIGEIVLGRIERSTVGNRPYNLVKVEGTPDFDRAGQIWAALQTRQLAFNEPSLIPGMQPPPPKNQQQANGYAPPAAGQQQSYAPAPQGAPPGYPAYGPPSAQAAPSPYTQPGQYGPPPQGYAPPAAPAPAPGPVLPPPPQGWSMEQWAALAPPQRDEIVAAMNAQAQQAPAGYAPAGYAPGGGQTPYGL